jgi:hypothetical protein
MINKGELCMDYQNTDEVARKAACEKVKQIANAIIKIRKKYYLCFSRISAEDQKRYDELKMQMERVACENGLEKLHAQLIGDINTQFDEHKLENGNTSRNETEDLYQKFINAISLQAELTAFAYKVIDTDPKLANAYLKNAEMCQKRAKEYEGFLILEYGKNKISCDRLTVLRDKFGELTQGYMPDLLKLCYEKFTSKDPRSQGIITNTMLDLSGQTTKPETEMGRA